jgi:uncharacterized protein YkwD
MMNVRTALATAAAHIMVLVLPCGALAAAHAKAAAGGAEGCAGATVIPASPALSQAAADAVLCLVNGERAQRRLRAVVASGQLTRAAAGLSADMVRRGYFAHVSPDGVDMRARVARSGYLRKSRRPYLGETIGWGADMYATPTELVKSLMESPEHKAIILDGRYREVGVGLALGAPMAGMGGSGATLALDFGRR